MKRITIALLSLVLSNALMADSAMIKQKLSEKLVNTKIDEVVPSTEFPSLYEIQMGPNIFFTDETANFLLIGHVFDLNGTDLTQAKLTPKIEEYRKNAQAEELKRQEAYKTKLLDQRKTIDLKKALKIGRGKHEVLVFTNTECHFCRDSERMIEGGDMTKYIYLTTYLAPQLSKPKSVHILCSKSPANEYEKVMRGELDGKPLATCKNGEKQLDEMMQEASKLERFGTPLFFIDGQVINGADPIIKNLVK